MEDTGMERLLAARKLFSILREYPDFDAGGPLPEAIDMWLAGKTPGMVASLDRIEAALGTPTDVSVMREESDASLPAFSCARRANDSSNEFAACLQHCGDDKRCIRTLSDAERIEAQELRELILTIRRWLNTPADSWFNRAAEAVMAIHPQYAFATPHPQPPSPEQAQQSVQAVPEAAPMPEGWTFNAARVAEGAEADDGLWEIGADNGEWFAPILMVDTGNYGFPNAEPLARAILARLSAPGAAPPMQGEPDLKALALAAGYGDLDVEDAEGQQFVRRFAALLLAAPSVPTQEMTDERIEAIVAECGGTWDDSVWIFEDADLHPFVRTCIEAAMNTTKGAAE